MSEGVAWNAVVEAGPPQELSALRLENAQLRMKVESLSMMVKRYVSAHGEIKATVEMCVRVLSESSDLSHKCLNGDLDDILSITTEARP